VSYVSEAYEKQMQTLSFLTKLYEDTGRLQQRITGTRISYSERKQWTTDIHGLSKATPFYWNRRTTELVCQTMDVFNLDEIVASRHLPYCDHGWMWFGEKTPFDIWLPKLGESHSCHAISWYIFNSGYLEDDKPVIVPFIGLTAWADNGMGPQYLLPTMWCCTNLGDKMSVQLPDKHLNFIGSFDEKTDQELEKLRKFFVASQVFIRQKFLSLEIRGVEKHFKKRVERENPERKCHPDIHVVQLRKVTPRQPNETQSEHEHREYQFQWTVKGHTRQQWYPSLQEHLPVYIHPYIKGPDDKPMKPRQTPIMAVVR
jgi:hypothetical protein